MSASHYVCLVGSHCPPFDIGVEIKSSSTCSFLLSVSDTHLCLLLQYDDEEVAQEAEGKRRVRKRTGKPNEKIEDCKGKN